MTVGDEVLRFGYDANGAPLYVIWNVSKYFYTTNLQGDVVAIVSANGNPVVEYTYDAWGNILSITGSRADNLGKYNPLRYRGYVYDIETELYYLQSRYYDPEWGRFLNADGYVSTGQGLLGNNMFAYCLNNPINRIDVTGSVSLWYYLILDSDMGFVHRAVQKHIASVYNVETEVTLSTFGRADVLQAGSVWEIKHAGTSTDTRIVVAYAQALTYVLFNDEVMRLGSARAYENHFYISCLDNSYLIEYTTPTEGVILYTVTEVSNYSGEYAFAYYPEKSKHESTNQSAILPGVLGVTLCCAIAGRFMPICRENEHYLYACGN